jgi:hypothetical protein
VLIPRPETELIVEAALDLLGADPSRPLDVADACTGCGNLAIARDPQVSYDVSFRHVANGKQRMLMALEDLAQTGAAAPKELQRALE